MGLKVDIAIGPNINNINNNAHKFIPRALYYCSVLFSNWYSDSDSVISTIVV